MTNNLVCSTLQLNASMGGNSPFDRKSTMNRSGEKRRSNLSESEDQRLLALHNHICMLTIICY